MRAVFPTPQPHIRFGVLDAEGDYFIQADGLGCFAYVKHPVIVWLATPPRRLTVVASAAL